MRIELICFLYNKKMVDDLGLTMPDIEAKIVIETDNIESIRERGTDDTSEICDKTCMVNMKSGDSFQIGIPYREMLKLWE